MTPGGFGASAPALSPKLVSAWGLCAGPALLTRQGLSPPASLGRDWVTQGEILARPLFTESHPISHPEPPPSADSD